MNKIIILTALSISACMPPAQYVKNTNLTQQDKDDAACDVLARQARNPYFPDNPFLNREAYNDSFKSCMTSKGYSS
jgi:hypothetical protein